MEAMSASVLSALGVILKDVVSTEVRSMMKVKGQVKSLAKQLDELCELLSGLELGHGESLNQALFSQAIDVMYECDHIVDTYTVTRRTPWPHWLKVLHHIKDQIPEIAPRLASTIAKLVDGTGLTNLSLPSSLPASKAPSFPYLTESYVGREDSVEDIVSALLETGDSGCLGRRRYSVVSILGMDGLGKTALAKTVLSHPRVRCSFQGFAWACMSQGKPTRELAADILCSLCPDLTEEVQAEVDEMKILNRLREVQLTTRCLVVLDDLCSETDWDCMRHAFPLDRGPSVLLVTTRKRELSLHIKPTSFDHWLRVLSEEESLNLLKQIIESSTSGLDTDMEESARKMLELCGGLPLAIRVLGGILSRRSTLADWEDVRKNLGLSLKFEDRGRLPRVVLDRCYQELSPLLKRLFLYLGLFPRGYHIPAKKLFQMWTAEGFFLPHREFSEAEVEKELSKSLVDRGMVQAIMATKYGEGPSKRVKSYCLHNLIRELCISKAKEGDLLYVLDLQSYTKSAAEIISSSGLSSRSKIRRLSVLLGREADGDSRLTEILDTISLPHLRTLLLCREEQGEQRNWTQMHHVFDKCRHLRVLSLEGFESVEGSVPESIGDLAHLRYLSFRNTQVLGLPRSLRNLRWLEFLDLRVRCSPTTPALVPNVLHKMKRLKHLYLPRHFTTSTTEKLRLHSLVNLQTLKNFNPAVCAECDLGQLSHLQNLSLICSIDEVERFSEFVANNRIKFRHIPCHSIRLRTD